LGAVEFGAKDRKEFERAISSVEIWLIRWVSLSDLEDRLECERREVDSQSSDSDSGVARDDCLFWLLSQNDSVDRSIPSVISSIKIESSMERLSEGRIIVVCAINQP
jgi:hypothetical protein